MPIKNVTKKIYSSLWRCV